MPQKGGRKGGRVSSTLALYTDEPGWVPDILSGSFEPDSSSDP